MEERRIDRRRAVASFAPDAVFGYVRWRANGFGTELWRAYVLRSGAPGQALHTIPGVAPGADILVSISGANPVKRLLALIDEMKAAGLAPDAPPQAYWRVVQNRLAAGLPLRIYSSAEQDQGRRTRGLAT